MPLSRSTALAVADPLTLCTQIASSVPGVNFGTDFLRLFDAASATNGNAPVSKSLTLGQRNWTYPLNQNALSGDLAARYGSGGIYAVAFGLALSPGNGLTVIVAPGHAVIDGIVEVPAPVAVAGLPNNAQKIYLWLTRAGSISISTRTTDPPVLNACYLGMVTTSGGTVTGFDYSGVCFVRGGFVWRCTGDYGAPQDSPPAEVQFFTRTHTGVYYYDSTGYTPLAGAVAAAVDNSISLADELCDLRQAHHRLLLRMVNLFGTDFLTESLMNDFECAVAELGE